MPVFTIPSLGTLKKDRSFYGLLALSLIAGALVFFNPPDPITSLPEGKEIMEGIDVSNHQGYIEWERIDQNQVNFVFMKATEGETFTDKSFRSNWEAAEEAGFLRGAYHFYREESSGKDQAEHFIDVVPREAYALPPVVDVELLAADGEAFVKELKVFLSTLEEHYGQKPLIYCNRATYDAYIKENFQDYGLWYADYNSPPPIEGWLFWQFTDNGNVAGIEGPVDFNQYSGTREELLELADFKD